MNRNMRNMRIGFIAPPFISVPPKDYGGTELFIAQLAEGLKGHGIDSIVYTNAESTVAVEKRWLYEHSEWPIRSDIYSFIKEANHTSWAMHEAATACDVLHVQPAFREYFERKIKPEIDGDFIQYIGVADLKAKNELLGNSLAMLFPIQWNEPFGLVMVEAMACGTPVLALRGGSVPEVVKDGISGYVCRSVRELATRVKQLNFKPA